MKFSIVILLTLLLQIHRASFAALELKENQTEVDQPRSARVHRTSDYESFKNDDSRTISSMKDVMMKQTVLLGMQELEKLIDFSSLNNLVQHQAQLFKKLNIILKTLIRDGTVTLRNIELAINEIMDTSTPSTPIKTVSENNNGFSITRIEGMEKQQLETVKNPTEALDNLLMEI